MNASELIDEIIAKITDWRGVTLSSIRKIIRSADPEIVEDVKWMGTPVWSHNGIVCLAKAFKDKVKLTFYEGASLSDPTNFSTVSSRAKNGERLTFTGTTKSMSPHWPPSFIQP